MKVLCVALPFTFTRAYEIGCIYDAKYSPTVPDWRVNKSNGWGLYMDEYVFKKCFKEVP